MTRLVSIKNNTWKNIISKVARTANESVVTTSLAHTYKVGSPLTIDCSDTSFNVVDVDIAEVTEFTVTYLNAGDDSAEATATGYVGVKKTWTGTTVAPGAYLDITHLVSTWTQSSKVLSDVGDGTLIVSTGETDGSGDIADGVDGWNWMTSNRPLEVIPTTPKNEHNLKPLGMCHACIDSSLLTCEVTLSNKTESTYTYSSTIEPTVGTCIFDHTNDLRVIVASVDTQAITMTLENDSIGNGVHTLHKPHNVDYKIVGANSTYWLWGAYADAADYGDDDYIRLQIVDVDNIFGYGYNVVIKDYDECWVRHLCKLGVVDTPSKSPGEIPTGLAVRSIYYPTDATKTATNIWLDFILTDKDA